MLAEQGDRADLARWMYEEAIAAAESEERPLSPRLVQVAAGFMIAMTQQKPRPQSAPKPAKASKTLTTPPLLAKSSNPR